MYRVFLCIFLTSCLFGQDVIKGKIPIQRKTYEGHAAMGPNHFMGGPIADLGEPFGLLNLYSVALYNPFGDEPIRITADLEIKHPYSAILATIVDPTFAAVGSPVDFPELINVPLHEVPIALDGIGEVETPLPGPHLVGQTDAYQAFPHEPITLGKWLEARGTATFECISGSSAMMTIDVQSMLPNSLYTVWGIFGGGGVVIHALGGQPNVIATDEQGNGRIRRVINFCPMSPREGNRPMLWISIAYHSNHAVYGNVPAPFLWPEGLVHHTQLQFFIDAAVLEEKK